jgi:WD40 repeat protein
MNTVRASKISSGVGFNGWRSRKVALIGLAVLFLSLWYLRGSAREIRGQRLGTVRQGAEISFAELSPDARLACVLDETPTSTVWRLDQIMPVAKLPGLSVEGITAWAPGKPWLATNEFLEGMRAYDFAGQKARMPWHSSRGSVLSADWSPDGCRLAVASDTWIRLLDATTGQIDHEWPAGVLDIHDPLVAWSPDSQRLAVAGTTGLVFLDCESGREIKRFRISEYGPRRLTWSPDSQLLAVREFADRGFPSWINIYHATTGRRLQRFHCWDVPRLAEWSPDGKLLLIGAQMITGYPGAPVLAVMNARSGRYVARLGPSRLPWAGARWTPGVNTVTAVRQDGEVWTWKLPPGLGNTRAPSS